MSCNHWIKSIITFFLTTILIQNRCHGKSVKIKGAGASFPVKVYKSWSLYYENHRSEFKKVKVEYDSIGSGGGKTAITQDNLEVDYAGSDSLLSEENYDDYPDLQMFPTMAGAIVIGFNLPDIEELIITRGIIVGMYNGTISNWNDVTIQEVNPDIVLPDAQIVPIARSDKSGTTEIFTKALSSFDDGWGETRGYFNQGFNDSDWPINWDPDVVNLFGYTNRGIAGMLLSVKYSVAYVSLTEANEANIKYATIINAQGNIVHPDTDAMQDAMDAKLSQFTDRFTLDLVDASGSLSYPIVSFTYMILRMDSFTDCDKAIELYRYIEWFTTDEKALQTCEDYYMAGVSKPLQEKIHDRILSKMKCKGKDVSKLVEHQKHEEWLSAQYWRLPVFISAPIGAILIILILSFVTYQQIKMNQAIWKKEYMIPESKLHLLSLNKKTGRSLISMKLGSRSTFDSQHSETNRSIRTNTTTEYTFSNVTLAVYNEQDTFLREVKIKPNQLKIETKRSLLWMRDKVHNLNVLEFYGLTTLSAKCFQVSQCCLKGVLQDILQNENLKLDLNFRFSMSCDLAQGLQYLHRIGIIHGHLNSSVCFIDSRWTVKIAEWELYHLSKIQNDRKIFQNNQDETVIKDEDGKSRVLFWSAPEIAASTHESPTEASDVFSLGILIIEIFTREDPYDELSLSMQPKEILDKIINHNLRPAIPTEFPDALHTILDQCWYKEPRARPNSSTVSKMLNKAKPSKKSVLDCMMTAVENYAVHLEDQVEARTMEVKKAMQKLEDLLFQMLPRSVAEEMFQGRAVAPKYYENVTIFFSDIVGFTALASESTPLEIVTLLNDLYTAFDSVIDKHEVYKVETIGDAYMVISGCPIKNGTHHAEHIAKMAIDFAGASAQFRVGHRPDTLVRLRVGMHSGPVASGVVGLKMPRYCLFGDTVNTASRMESTSVAQKMQLSEATKALLDIDSKFNLQLRGEIEVKGKGLMKTYWLHGYLDNCIPLPKEFLRSEQ